MFIYLLAEAILGPAPFRTGPRARAKGPEGQAKGPEGQAEAMERLLWVLSPSGPREPREPDARAKWLEGCAGSGDLGRRPLFSSLGLV